MKSDDKIERVRNATIECISKRGMANCSVSTIASIAAVSDGYLYRHYSGKDELINDVLTNTLEVSYETIQNLLAESPTIEEYIDAYILLAIKMAIEETDRYKFLILLQNDFSFKLNPDTVALTKVICNSILEKCLSEHSYRTDLSIEDIYIAFIVIPQQYIKLILKDDFNITTSSDDIAKKIKNLILRSIK